MNVMQQLILAIVEQHGQSQAFCDAAATPEFHLKVEAPGYLPLVIERLCAPDHGCQVVSICQYGRQNDDPMRDPEMCFDFQTWEPLYFRNDYRGVEQYVYTSPARKLCYPRLRAELSSFAAMWARNLRRQGFLDPERAR